MQFTVAWRGKSHYTYDWLNPPPYLPVALPRPNLEAFLMFANKVLLRCGFAFTLAMFLTGVVRANDVPTDPDARAKIVGQPKSLQAQPEKLTLTGPRSTAQVVISGLRSE